MKTYIAIPKSVLDVCWNGLTENSEGLGMFLVRPELKKGIFGKIKVIGFNEVITGEKLVNRTIYMTDYGTESVDTDAKLQSKVQVGDLVWEIVDKSTADRLLPPEEIAKYMSLTSEEVLGQLHNIRLEALMRGQVSNKKIKRSR